MPRIFALADLHLGLAVDKPMDRFGPLWKGHDRKIAERWREAVAPEDVVIVPGDISWAMRLDEAAHDLAFLGTLPGTKVLLKGNHDYWWGSLNQAMRIAPPGTLFLQNNAWGFGEVGIFGSRGWDLPGPQGFAAPEDEKIFKREVGRLSLSHASVPPQAKRKVAVMHFPPLLPGRLDSEFSRLLEEWRVETCVYGHLHLSGQPDLHDEPVSLPKSEIRNPKSEIVQPFEGIHGGVRYVIAAADRVDFRPILLGEF